MTATASAPALPLDEQAAALAEGIAEMPADLVALREEKIALQERKDALESRIAEIRDIFGKRLEEDGLQGYTYHGKVHARRSEVRTPRLDTKALKEKHPKIFAAFTKVTESVRVVIN